jgi:alpha-L-rhamnosidase
MRLPALLILISLGIAGATSPDLRDRPWPARWISVEGASEFDYGVYHFRRTFDVNAKPERFPIHVTADNRYQLYVNGVRVSIGPARGDLYHWRYETVDIAPQLRAGKNVLAAVVWNLGVYAPEAQVTHRTGFLVQGDTVAERIVDTGDKWKGVRDRAYAPSPVEKEQVIDYFAAGACERFNAALHPWGWERPDFNDSAWRTATAGQTAAPRPASDSPSRWMLIERPIPPMEERPERLQRVRRSSGVAVSPAFPAQRAPFTIAAHTSALLLLDQNYLTAAYPELELSGGKDSLIKLRYAEALITKPGSLEKGNRDEIEGKLMMGYQDVYMADGGANRIYRPLWWRTWRYIELDITTGDAPLTIEDFRATTTGYPFERRARFAGGPEEVGRILDVGWRTARLCAHETYVDCPYYEQLQYVGDTRIQALISIYMTGDGRLMRNAIELINSSRTAEGATYSRAPSRLQQYIPPFSLWWIGMLHD